MCDGMQIVAPAPPRWEADFRAWERIRDLKLGHLKEYPDVVSVCVADGRSCVRGEALFSGT